MKLFYALLVSLAVFGCSKNDNDSDPIEDPQEFNSIATLQISGFAPNVLEANITDIIYLNQPCQFLEFRTTSNVVIEENTFTQLKLSLGPVVYGNLETYTYDGDPNSSYSARINVNGEIYKAIQVSFGITNISEEYVEGNFSGDIYLQGRYVNAIALYTMENQGGDTFVMQVQFDEIIVDPDSGGC